MKKTVLGTMAAAIAATGLGLVSSPSGQQLAEQAMNQSQQQIEQQQTQRVNNNAQRSVAQNTGTRTIVNSMSNPYSPTGGGGTAYSVTQA